MRCLLIMSLVASLFVSCTRYENKFPKGTKREGALIGDESDKPYYADHWQRQLAEHPNPKEAVRQADAYFDSLPYAQRMPHRDKVRVDFCRSFFQGFTMPSATMSGGTDAGQRGFVAGQEYRQGNPEKVKEIMEGFGYTVVEATGVWTAFFEHSGFRPDTQPKQTWWLSGFGDTQSDLPKGEKIPVKGVHIRVRGYLSPSGQFGHLGSYDHELFATSISKTDG
jgi:hypothetical protein